MNSNNQGNNSNNNAAANGRDEETFDADDIADCLSSGGSQEENDNDVGADQ